MIVEIEARSHRTAKAVVALAYERGELGVAARTRGYEAATHGLCSKEDGRGDTHLV